MKSIQKHLLTLYTRSPLHVGSGTSVDVVDLPIMRERITHFPIIPSTSLKGVLRQEARDFAASDIGKAKGFTLAIADALFGVKDDPQKDAKGNDILHAGCVQIMEAKLLVFPVRSLAGCFAWLTCPTVLCRFHRDTGYAVPIPKVEKENVIPGADLVITVKNGGKQVVLEEYALTLQHEEKGGTATDIALALNECCHDSLWQKDISRRLACVHDEQFQHLVTSCTEIVARIVIDPAKRTNTNLFNQENVPCESLFYSVLRVLPVRKPGTVADLDACLVDLLTHSKVLQVGGDETTGHGLCATHHQPIA